MYNCFMFNVFRRSDVLVGFDVGAFGVKAAKIKKNGDKFSIEGLYFEPFLPNEDKTEVLISSKIKKLCTKAGIKGKVNVSVDVADVIVRDIKVPVVPDNELSQVIAWEAKKMVEITPETHNIDFFIHNQGEVEAGGKYKGMFVAARKDFLASRVKAFEDAGLEISYLGLEADAYRALIPLNPKIESRIPTAIVDIGYSSTTIAIFHMNKLLFTRELNVSISRIVSNIVETQNIEINEAIEKLLNVSLRKSDTYDTVEAIVTPDIETVASELNRSFNFFTSVAQKGMVDRVFVTGGLAEIDGINEFMLERLGIITKAFNPVEGLQLNCKVPGINDQFTVALGMALIKWNI